MEKQTYRKNRKKYRGGAQNNRKNRGNREEPVRDRRLPEIVCALCGSIIADIKSAIIEPGSETPAHFDCMLNKLKKAHKLSGQESICYIGSGKFAIVERNNKKNAVKINVKREIFVENRQKTTELLTDLIVKKSRLDKVLTYYQIPDDNRRQMENEQKKKAEFNKN